MDAGSFDLSCGDRKQSPDPLAGEDEIAELQARQSSMIRLADALKEDLNRYLNLGEVTAKEVERKSFETAIELPESSPEIWLEVVSSSYEMTGTELTRKFPAAPSRGFRKALKYLQSRNNRQLSFL